MIFFFCYCIAWLKIIFVYSPRQQEKSLKKKTLNKNQATSSQATQINMHNCVFFVPRHDVYNIFFNAFVESLIEFCVKCRLDLSRSSSLWNYYLVSLKINHCQSVVRRFFKFFVYDQKREREHATNWSASQPFSFKDFFWQMKRNFCS